MENVKTETLNKYARLLNIEQDEMEDFAKAYRELLNGYSTKGCDISKIKTIRFNDNYGLSRETECRHKKQFRLLINELLPTDIIMSLETLGDEVKIIANNGEKTIYLKLEFNVGEIVIINSWSFLGVGKQDDIALLIKGIRIEKLQNISDKDCIREGISFYPRVVTEAKGIKPYAFFDYTVINRTPPYFKSLYFDTAREAFAELADRIYGEGTWESNPYVFVYEFEVLGMINPLDFF